MRWTKGKYQFFVCTHIDKGHVHNHIYYNSTAYDRSRKFRNFIGSTFALRRLSDLGMYSSMNSLSSKIPNCTARGAFSTMASGWAAYASRHRKNNSGLSSTRC